MKHATVTILAFLLLGAAINVAVAWGCALWSPVGKRVPILDVLEDNPARRLVPAEWLDPKGETVARLRNCRLDGVGVQVDNLFVIRFLKATEPAAWGPFDRVHVVRAGWPLPAMQCHTIAELRTAPPADARWHGGFVSPALLQAPSWRVWPPLGTSRPIPLRPVWSGLALNTLLYGAACLVLLGGPFAVRRWRRGRRGLCLRCGYPVWDLAACPECGAVASAAVCSAP